MGDTPKKKYKKLSPRRFLQVVYEKHFNVGTKFCFILGSGASKSSGIRTAPELMREWIKDLKAQKHYNEYVKEAAESIGLQNYERFLQDDYEPTSDDYFPLFELRFADMQDVAYRFLEKEMTIDEKSASEKDKQAKSGGVSASTLKFPSYGYLSLACLLCDSENRFVVTTNFDYMVEEALSVCRGVRPLVIGHETLARFIDSDPHRPVIAKVHRDLLYQPMNTSAEMQTLREEWKEPLSGVLTNCIPIVIGYAGADHTLMDLLMELPLKGIFWCGMSAEPPKPVRELLEKNEGYWIKIDGFDEIVYRLLLKFRENEAFDRRFVEPLEYIKNHSALNTERYEQQKQNLIKATAENETKASGTRGVATSDAEVKAERSEKAAMIESLNNSDHSGEGIVSASDLSLSAIIAYFKGEYKLALEEINKAIELNPDNTNYHLKGEILSRLELYNEAIECYNKAIELLPNDSSIYISRGYSFAELKRYDNAIADYSKVIELHPADADAYNNRAYALYRMQSYDKALCDVTRALDLEPDDCYFLDTQGAILTELGHYDEALDDFANALELDTEGKTHGEILTHRARLYDLLNRPEDAAADRAKVEALKKAGAA